MNKQQIIAPLVTMGIVAVIGLFLVSRQHRREFLMHRAYSAGSEIINTTNSSFLRVIGPDLQGRLVELLGSPTVVEPVAFGDEPAPIGNGKASVRLFLKNQAGQRIAIRLRWNSDVEKFDVLGFWTP